MRTFGAPSGVLPQALANDAERRLVRRARPSTHEVSRFVAPMPLGTPIIARTAAFTPERPFDPLDFWQLHTTTEQLSMQRLSSSVWGAVGLIRTVQCAWLLGKLLRPHVGVSYPYEFPDISGSRPLTPHGHPSRMPW